MSENKAINITTCERCEGEVILMKFHGHEKCVDLNKITGLTVITDAYGEPLGTEMVTIFPLHSEMCLADRRQGYVDRASGKYLSNDHDDGAGSESHPPTAPVIQDPLTSNEDQVVTVCYDKDDAIIGRVFASGKHTGTIDGDKVARRDSLRGDPTPDLTLKKPDKKDRK